METAFLDKFSRDIDKIKQQDVKSNIVEVIEEVEQAKRLTDIHNLKKLKGFKNAYRIRIGDYRIGIFVERNTVTFARVVHRSKIYDIFP